MFRIRREQLDFLGRRSQDEFVSRMAAYLRTDFVGDTALMTDEALEDWVRRCVETAIAHGITLEPEVAQYMLLCLPLGERAPEVYPWVAAILDDRGLHGSGKIRALLREVRERWPTDVGPYVIADIEAA